MERVLIVSIVSKYSKYPLPKIWVAYLSAEELAQLLNCEVVDYRCGHGDPRAEASAEENGEEDDRK